MLLDLTTQYPPWNDYTGSEKRHYASGPKIFDAMCGVENGIYFTPYWRLVTCETCLDKKEKI